MVSVQLKLLAKDFKLKALYVPQEGPSTFDQKLLSFT